jgi:OOP family OmpA-OmpF porin
MAIGKLAGSSYYKQSHGRLFDRDALKATKRALAGKGDGRVSKADADRIAKKLTDGGKLTDVEKATVRKIRRDANLTAAGNKELGHDLRSAGQLHKKTPNRSGAL